MRLVLGWVLQPSPPLSAAPKRALGSQPASRLKTAGHSCKLQPASRGRTVWFRQRRQAQGRRGVGHGQAAALALGNCSSSGDRVEPAAGAVRVACRVEQPGHYRCASSPLSNQH